MANYTIELRKIVEHGIPIFDFPYEFYNEEKRAEFEKNFIRHFYFREIGCETVDRFKHYLEDKMNLVFPYYNALFNAAQIEYNILDNYNIKEEYEITRENKGKTSGVSSTVGRTEDNQTSNVKDVNEGKTTTNIDNKTTQKDTETGGTTTHETITDNGNTSRDVTTTGGVDKTTNMDEETTDRNTKKFLDTPQGALDLDKVDYLTNLTQDSGGGTKDSDIAEKTTSNESVKETGTSGNTKTVDGETSTNHTLNGETDLTGKTDVTDNNNRNTDTTYQGQQKLTQDNNTRTESIGNQIEKSVYTKKGNIGVDTDADMIQKHIKLQQVLRKIELMFFDECEDLFMLVY